ncbi:TPA: hypothetical protein ACQXR8_001953, partial [Streptococcus pneumoniae]
KIGSIISIVDLPTTNIIEPEFVKRDDPSFLMPKMANRDRSPLSSSKSSSKAGLYGKIERSDKRE